MKSIKSKCLKHCDQHLFLQTLMSAIMIAKSNFDFRICIPNFRFIQALVLYQQYSIAYNTGGE